MKLICVDLEAPLPTVAVCTEGEQWVLVRLHGEPLGIVYPPREGCGPGELRRTIVDRLAWSIARHLVADSIGGPTLTLDDLGAVPSSCPRAAVEPALSMSVAVCTRNRAAQLTPCLDALTALAYPRPILDILVVDNAPADDSTRDVVARYPQVRYIREPRPGLDRARNRAALEARGEIVAYTDDDVSVDGQWARSIARAFEDERDAACVTGLVVPDELDTPAQMLFEKYGGFGRGFDRGVHRAANVGRTVTQFGGTGRFGTGANMAFRRSFLLDAGLFDPALDVGTPSNGGGDLEMFFRVLKRGAALVYEPSAIVRHRHRRSHADLRRQIANNGIGFYAYLARTARAYPEERGAVWRLGAWWLWWWNLRRLARGLLPGAAVPLDLVIAELKGSLIGPFRYRPEAS